MVNNIDERIDIDSITYADPSTQKPSIMYGNGSSAFGAPLLDSSSYSKYDLAINDKLDWKDELMNLRSFEYDKSRNFTAPTKDVRSELSKKEKQRIKDQGESPEFNRTDFFAIGTVYLTIPPTQISISEEKHNFRYKTLRSSGDVITTSGRSTTRIDLDIVFSGKNDIDNKLRPLIAQFKCTPFLPIENDYVRSMVEPESRGILGLLENEKSTVSELEKKKTEVDKTQAAESARNSNISELIKEIRSLESRGIIKAGESNYLQSVANKWYMQKDAASIIRDPVASSCLVPAKTANGHMLDFKALMYKTITVPDHVDNTLPTINKSIQDIDSLNQSINSIDEVVNSMFDKDLEERLRNKRIVGVISQFTTSTMPGYPEALSCRISMYVFNYDPYVFDFGFIKGYDPESYTPDITECDLFIDWYSNRFLGTDNLSLKEYSPSDATVITYTKNISYDELIAGSVPVVDTEKIVIEDETFITGISVTMRNIIQFLPLLSGDKPTCQYMGAYNSSVVINISSKNVEKIKELRRMHSIVSRLSRTNNRLGRHVMFLISNPLLALCGTRYFILENFSVDTVPGSPGLYSVNMESSEIKLGLEQSQHINRLTLDSNERVLEASKFIFDAAIRYMNDTSPGKRNAIADKFYYDMLFESDTELGSTTFGKVIKNNLPKKDYGAFPSYYSSPERKIEISKIRNWRNPYQSIYGPEWEGTPNFESGMNNAADATAYINSVFSCMKGDKAYYPDGSEMTWESVQNYVTHAYAEENMQNIKVLLNPSSTGAVELKNFVYKNATTTPGIPKHIVEPSCYPDLELPTYSALGGKGDKFKLTYTDVGILTVTPAMRNKVAQTDWVAMEPDAFYPRKSIHRLLDNLGSSGLDTAAKSFKGMALNNLNAQSSPLDPSIFEDTIVKAIEANANVKLIDTDESSSIDVRGELQNKELIVVRAVDANTFEVKEKGGDKSYFIRESGYNPKKYTGGSSNPPSNAATLGKSLAISQQPEMFSSADTLNTDIANKVLQGKTIYAAINDGQSYSDNGRLITEATCTFFNSDTGDQESVAVAMEKSGMTMQSTTKSSNDSFVNKINNQQRAILGDLSFSISRGTGEIATDDSSITIGSDGIPTNKNEASNLGKGIVSTVMNGLGKTVKAGETEVTSVGVKTKGDKGGAIESNQFIVPAAIQASKDQDFNKNSTIARFDKYGLQHLDSIMDRLRYQTKDNRLRMVKAFPTFKFYFIEEDKMEFKPYPILGELKNLDDIYSYNAILSIDITKSKNDAADVAMVQILNTKGLLDRDRFGLFDQKSNNVNRSYDESIKLNNKETADEQDEITEFILKAGTRIVIKMGYCSDPTFLDTVFTGMISDVSVGDVITVVAQGYGVELMQKITGWGNKVKYQDYAPYKVLDELIKRPEVAHFGFKEWVPLHNVSQRLWGRRLLTSTGAYDPESYKKLKHPSIWRTWLGVSYLMLNANNPSNSNIWTPEISKWDEESHGDGWEFMVENKTIWEVFQEYTRRMPGYITQVLPFDNRATIYFGPSDGYYSYSNEVRGLVGESNAYASDPSLLIESSLAAGDLVELDLDQKKNLMNRVNNILNKVRADDHWSNAKLWSGGAEVALPDKNVSWILSAAQESLAASGNLDDRSLLSDFMRMDSTQGIIFNDIIKRDSISFREGDITIFNATDDDKLNRLNMYQDKNGRFVDKETYVKERWDDGKKHPPNCKLIRSYHYVDSLRSIVSNNITASEENMWNRVEVAPMITGKRFGMLFSPIKYDPNYRVTAQVDDSIWKECIKTKIVSEPNAKSVRAAWLYAIGHLCQGINAMYGGHLTVLGDPSIKPNDVVFLNDYYTDMHGAFSVREVNHHFSHDTGFITTVIPDCISYANNSMAMASETVAGGYMDDVARSMNWVYNIKVPFLGRGGISGVLGVASIFGAAYGIKATPGLVSKLMGKIPTTKFITSVPGQPSMLGGAIGKAAGLINRPAFVRAGAMAYTSASMVTALGDLVGALVVKSPVIAGLLVAGGVLELMGGKEIRNGLQAMQFAVTGWSRDRREPINFLPLYYAGRPYIAGVKGMRRSCWWEPYAEGFQRFVYYHFNQSPQYISDIIRQASSESLSSSAYQPEVK